jgi:hypothetical protein
MRMRSLEPLKKKEVMGREKALVVVGCGDGGAVRGKR